MAPQGGDKQWPTRRSLLCAAGLTGLSAINSGLLVDRSTDSDGDGIPDETKRSESVHRRLTDVFGSSQFEGFEVGRSDLLVDARYVGEARLFPETKQAIVGLCHSHGIYAQWLDYPHRYSRVAVADRYGSTVEDLLVGRDSFYADAIADDLRDIAVQLVVVPGTTESGPDGRIYSEWMDRTGGGREGYVNGFSVGNRAVVADRDDRFTEARLVLHELAHLALCHDDDPENTGVMGSGSDLNLTAEEWDRFRDGLSNVRDRTGYDVAFRSCLWTEHLRTAFGDTN